MVINKSFFLLKSYQQDNQLFVIISNIEFFPAIFSMILSYNERSKPYQIQGKNRCII